VADCYDPGMSIAAHDGQPGNWDGHATIADEARLLRFYDRLRGRVVGAAGSRSPLGRNAVEVLLLVPDVFVLLVRLAFDREVPAESRRLIVGALAYYLLPVDLMPEAFLGGVGFLDDVVLASAVLSHTLGGNLEHLAGRYWSGSHGLRTTVHGIAAAAHSVLGARVHERVRRFLAARGIELRHEG
jgi:uncharacterized membrane protein YkvA (DUF1232 family)